MPISHSDRVAALMSLAHRPMRILPSNQGAPHLVTWPRSGQTGSFKEKHDASQTWYTRPRSLCHSDGLLVIVLRLWLRPGQEGGYLTDPGSIRERRELLRHRGGL